MYIIKLVVSIFTILLLVGTNTVYAQATITTEHFVEMIILENSSTEVSHKIKITNLDKYNGVESIDFNEISQDFNYIKNFNVDAFEIINVNDISTIKLTQPLIGPKSVEIGYKYVTDKIFYKNGLNYALKLIKIKDKYSKLFTLKIFLPDNIVKSVPFNLLNYLKTHDKNSKYIELNTNDLTHLGNEIIFGNNAVYLLTLKHLVNKDKPYIIIPANLENRQIITVLSISKEPNSVYKKYSNVYFQYNNIKNLEFIEAVYLVEVKNNNIQHTDLEQIGLNLTSSQKFWNYNSKNIQNEIQKIKSNNDIRDYAKKAYDTVKNKLSYNNSTEFFSFTERIGAENINNENSNKAYCLDYTDYLIALLRGLRIESAEFDGFYYQTDLDFYNVAKLHSWVAYKNSQNTYKEVDPTFDDTSDTNYFTSFDLSHIILTIKTQNPEIPYVFGTYTQKNMYESLKIKSLKMDEIENINYSNAYFVDLFLAKYVVNNSGKFLKNFLPYQKKIINNSEFNDLKNNNKNIIFEQKDFRFLFPQNFYIYLICILPIIIFIFFKFSIKFINNKNKGKKVKSVL